MLRRRRALELGEPPISFVPPPEADLWFRERHTPGTALSLRIRQTLFRARSPYQQIAVLDTVDFGRALVLDGAIQTTERDEFVYHEMLVHVPLCIHRRPRRVLVVGGGDGGCVREVLRHPTVEEVVLVEIDRMVIDCCREFLPSIAGELDDPRVRLCVEDGVRFVRRHKRAFDVILVDSTDPVNMASPLTRAPFFRAAREALAPGGIYACQSQGPVHEERGMRRIARTIRKVFPRTDFFLAHIPTYPAGVWSFAVATLRGRRPSEIAPRKLPAGVRTRYYTPRVHQAAFALPPFVEEILR